MRLALIAGVVAVIALSLIAIFLLREPDLAGEISDVTQNAKTTIHLRSNLAVTVDVADSDEERIKGLSGSDPLPANHGLLFIFNADGYPAIWMKDMNYAIDIIWIDREGTIVSIAPSVQPDSYPQIFKPAQPARYVLEMKAGYVDERNVQAGDQTDIHEKFPVR